MRRAYRITLFLAAGLLFMTVWSFFAWWYRFQLTGWLRTFGPAIAVTLLLIAAAIGLDRGLRWAFGRTLCFHLADAAEPQSGMQLCKECGRYAVDE